MSSNSQAPLYSCQYTLRATTDRKKIFHDKLVAKIRDAIGLSNTDQEEKEELLAEVCNKITTIHMRLIANIEEMLGTRCWGHNMPSDFFRRLSPEQQEEFKQNARSWIDVKNLALTYADERVVEICRIINECTTLKKGKLNERHREENNSKRAGNANSYYRGRSGADS